MSDWGRCALLRDGGVRCSDDGRSWADLHACRGAERLAVGATCSAGIRGLGSRCDRTACVLRAGVVLCASAHDDHFGRGRSESAPAVIAGVDDPVDVVTTGLDTCILDRSGRVRCYGELTTWREGDGPGTVREPVVIGGITDAVAIVHG